METANGGAMKIIGLCCFYAKYRDTTTEITALVAADTRDILVSWHDLLELNWELKAQLRSLLERRVTSQMTPKECEKSILCKFPTVFLDELSVKPMKAPPMKIHVKGGARPYRISTARQVPLRYREESEKEVIGYIKKGVIIKEDTPIQSGVPQASSSPSQMARESGW